MRHVIIGNSTAAVGAVEGIRSVDTTSPITIISEEPYHTYSRPLISYYLAEKVSEEDMLYRPEEFYRNYGVELISGRRAVSIDTDERKILLDNEEGISYDRLLIAAGGRTFLPPVEGLDKENVYTFLKWDDVKKIKEHARKGASAVIVGGGLIGIKAAESFISLGVKVTIVELADGVLRTILDKGASEIVQAEMENYGIDFKLGTTVKEICGDDEAEKVILEDGSEMVCDMLIMAIGVVPNTEVVEDTPVSINRGILVDEYMRTNVDDIFAAGDIAEGYDMVAESTRVLPILPNAYKQGRAAGLNMVSAASCFEGGFAMNSISFEDLSIATAGVQEGREIVECNPVERVYRKVFLREGRIVGFILINSPDRAGILTGLLKDKLDVSGFAEELVKEDFGYVDFPKELRKERLCNGGI